jgi:hypothetical protein
MLVVPSDEALCINQQEGGPHQRPRPRTWPCTKVPWSETMTVSSVMPCSKSMCSWRQSEVHAHAYHVVWMQVSRM